MATKRIKLNAYHTALGLIINSKIYADEKQKDISRFRFSRPTLRAISGWKRLSEVFVRDVSDELYGIGWTLIELSDTELAAIQTSKISVWPKLGGGRVTSQIRNHKNPAEYLEDTYEELFGDVEEFFED
ncbi:hypothetical protein BFW88_16495 [Pseudomonas fluorescens]|uniref:hypothetical protein n=1 Tax=Pseudomonas sp. 2822-15 TaxID=1712677 RepID=UPI0009995F8B|nr:hypothetical protein [Pseudomonas sp. 2822-15]OPA88179.1 hypothetical protein BFW88_16495 [Pseudomonas fluorescens]OPB07675.1 hypothetical protein BFW92_16420 [Pseudomonas fluorescens]OPB18947.1 hypothetical protein BFW93_16450 [Pseudomonas fluorescens]PIB40699.1 hypothetical protein AOA59_27120 [Pseudomonas sp. 2822-15]